MKTRHEHNIEVHAPQDCTDYLEEILTEMSEDGVFYNVIMERLQKKATELREYADEMEVSLSFYRRLTWHEHEALCGAQHAADKAEEALEDFGRYAEVYNERVNKPQIMTSEQWAKFQDLKAEMNYEFD